MHLLRCISLLFSTTVLIVSATDEATDAPNETTTDASTETTTDAPNETTTEEPSLTCKNKLQGVTEDPIIKLWENATVSYVVDSNFTFRDLQKIHGAFRIFEKYTCVRFRRKTDADVNYLHIINVDNGCISTVGYEGGEQFSTLESPICTRTTGVVLHELMHVLGFFHEHSRFDRDLYVDVKWDRIKSNSCVYFTKLGQNASRTFGLPYDFQSVLHYFAAAFSYTGEPTIISKDGDQQSSMGQRRGLSRTDIVRINKLYQCPNKNPEENKLYT